MPPKKTKLCSLLVALLLVVSSSPIRAITNGFPDTTNKLRMSFDHLGAIRLTGAVLSMAAVANSVGERRTQLAALTGRLRLDELPSAIGMAFGPEAGLRLVDVSQSLQSAGCDVVLES
jgi:hypothetical protein